MSISLNQTKKTAFEKRSTTRRLKITELAQLHGINAQLLEITKGMETSARSIALQLEARFKDGSDRLSDFDIDAEFSFQMVKRENVACKKPQNAMFCGFLTDFRAKLLIKDGSSPMDTGAISY